MMPANGVFSAAGLTGPGEANGTLEKLATPPEHATGVSLPFEIAW